MILPENSCNRDIRKMRTNELVFSIENASIVTLIEEGYKIYNADGVLMSEDEDKVLDESSYKEVFLLVVGFERCKDGQGEFCG